MLPTINQNTYDNLTHRLNQHHKNILNFLFYTNYQVIYLTFQQKQASYLQNIHPEEAPIYKQRQMRKHYAQMSERLHSRVSRDDILSDKALYRLQSLWENRQVGYFHRYYFEKYLCTAFLNKIPNYLYKQELLIRQQTHLYFAIEKAIFARETCLKIFKKQVKKIRKYDINDYLDNEYQKQQIIELKAEKYNEQGRNYNPDEDSQPETLKTKLETFPINFSHYKKLTLYVIDLIVKWREYIYDLTLDQRRKKDKIFYYYQYENYLLKILTDLQFLKQTALGEFFDLASMNDPFLLKPILSIQNKSEQRQQDISLKKLININQKQFRSIMQRLQILSHQYYLNIQRRKVYDMSRSRASSENRKGEQIIQLFKNSSLKKLDTKYQIQEAIHFPKPQFGGKLAHSNVRQILNKQQPIDKKQILMNELANLKRQKYSTVKLQKIQSGIRLKQKKTSINKIQQGIQQSGDNLSLSRLRQSLVSKIKQQITTIKPQFEQDQQKLQLMIDHEMREIEKQIFEAPKKSNDKIITHPVHNSNIKIQVKKIKQEYLKSEIEEIFKRYPQIYLKVQISQSELISIIKSIDSCILLEIKYNFDKLGYAFCGLDTDRANYKRIKIYHILIMNMSFFEEVMEEISNFFIENQDCFQVEFMLYEILNIPVLYDFIENLNNKLKQKCLIISKSRYSFIIQFRYIFKRHYQNIRYVHNRYPNKLYLNATILESKESLSMENTLNIDHTGYEFLIGQLFRKYHNLEEINILKQRCNWKHKLKKILEIIKKIEIGKITLQQFNEIETKTIHELNIKLKEKQEKMLELGDSNKVNQIKLINLKIIAQIGYPVQQTMYRDKSYYRININSGIKQLKTISSIGFFINLKDREQKLFIMKGDEYLEQQENLFLYLLKCFTQNKPEVIHADNIWLPMFGQKQFHERDLIYTIPKKLYEFNQIKKYLYYTEEFEFFCHSNLKNSLIFEKEDNDILIHRPIIVSVISHEFPIYCKCLI